MSLEAIPRGSELGRYLVLDQLGAGGMGVVLSAYDPELDRRVAVKLVRPDLCEGPRASEARARLQREAQAMARFSHPNVVVVYDVGTVDHASGSGQLFVAMEYVERDLLAWLHEAARPWREVLAIYLEAARGLAAAHAAELVHRDFKPANVLVGRDGRPRVSDFGLVAAFGDARAAALGTPAYMAPEQFAGEAVGAAADQFAFCVALYEALYRQRPFAGASYDEVAASVTGGALHPPDDRGDTPDWLWPVIERGLQRDPAARHDSMGALLAALEHDPAAVARRRVVLDAMLEFGRARAEAGDFDAAEAVLRDALHEATGAEDRERAASAQITLACVECGRGHLDVAAERLSWVGALVDQLAEGDQPLLRARVHQAAGYLAQRQATLPEACEALRRALACYQRALGPDAIALAEVRTSLGEALRALGRAEEACAELEQAHAHALRVRGTMSPQAAATLDILAGTLQDLGRFEEALQHYRAALDMRRTLLGPQHPLTADSHIHLGQILLMLSRYDEAAAELERGLAIAEAVSGPVSPSTRSALNNLGGVRLKQGDAAAAWELLERALAIAEHLFGPEHPEVASTLSNLGHVLSDSGEHERAYELYQRALSIRERALGETHPLVADAVNNIAGALLQRGRTDEALAAFERVREVSAAARGATHPSVALVDINLASTLMRCTPQRFDEAEGRLRDARAILEAAYGEDHDSLGVVHNLLGDIALGRGDLARAADHYQACIGINERIGRGLVVSLHPIRNLSHCLILLGRHAEAIAPLERALAVAAGLPPPSIIAGMLQGQLAAALWDGGGDRARAADLAREARALFAGLGAAGAPYLPYVDAWLRERRLD